jgi:hypothetical protein
MELKEIIVDAILHTLRNPPHKSMPRPTLEELEKMLNEEEPPKVDILPDGSLTAEGPVFAGDLADAILKALTDNDYCVKTEAEFQNLE